MQTIGFRKFTDFGLDPPIQGSAEKNEAKKFSSIAGKIFKEAKWSSFKFKLLSNLNHLLNKERSYARCWFIVGKLKDKVA